MEPPPTIGAEQNLDSPLVATIGANALDAAVAFDGTNYLVVWSDWRTDGAYADIWGARVDASGNVIDATSFPIATTPGVQQHPAVVFDGTKYVVVWEDYKVEGGTEADLAAATVSTDGVVTALPALATTPASETAPALARTPGGGVVAAWVAGGQIVTGFVEGGSGSPVTITSSAEPSSGPSLAAASSGEILVAYSQQSATTQTDTYAQRLSATGALTGGPIAISTGVSRTAAPSVAFDGTNFIVAFVDYATGVDIYGTRVTQAGAVLDHHSEGGNSNVGGALIVHATAYQELPSITCGVTPGECLVAWQDTRNLPTPTALDVFAVRVQSSNLAPIGSPFLVSNAPHNQTTPRVVGSSTGYFVVWQDARGGGDGQLRAAGARIAANGTNLDPGGLIIDRGYNFQRFPAVAASPAGVLVGWNDSRSLDGDDIMATRLDLTGSQSTPVGGLSTAAYTQQDSAITAFGDDFLYAWRDQRNGIGSEIRIARVSGATGTVLDPDGVLVSPDDADQWALPAVASSGTEALVVWEHATLTAHDIYGAIVHADGTAEPQFAIAVDSERNERPAVAWDASAGQYVVVWQAGPASQSTPTEIRGARVQPDGTVLDPGGVLLASGGGMRSNAHVAFNGGVGLVLYQDYETDWNVFAFRIAAGAQLALTDSLPIPLTTDDGIQAAGNVTALGSDFFVVWSNVSTSTSSDVWGQWVPATGTIATTPFAITANPEDEASPAVAALDSTDVLVAYGVHRTDVDARRVVTRTLAVPAPTCQSTD